MGDEVAELEARVERFYVWFTDFTPPATLARFAEVVAVVAADADADAGPGRGE